MTDRQTPDIEALAVELAWEGVYEHVMSDRWFGYPNGDKEEHEAMVRDLPSAREAARRYARLLGVLETEEDA